MGGAFLGRAESGNSVARHHDGSPIGAIGCAHGGQNECRQRHKEQTSGDAQHQSREDGARE